MLLSILAVSIFPQIAVLSGLFELLRAVGIYDTLGGLIFSYMAIVLPFTVWILRGFMQSIPKEIEEAAILDGCGPWRIVFRVFLPLLNRRSPPPGFWLLLPPERLLFALSFTLSADRRTVPVAIAMLTGGSEHELPWGNILAASILVTVPLIVLVAVFQRQIVTGLTVGAVKG